MIDFTLLTTAQEKNIKMNKKWIPGSPSHLFNPLVVGIRRQSCGVATEVGALFYRYCISSVMGTKTDQQVVTHSRHLYYICEMGSSGDNHSYDSLSAHENHLMS